MATLDDIKYADWQPKLNEIGSVVEATEDINQCIKIILLTQKGSVPHRPTFGSKIFDYIDNPINIAKPNIIREVIDAIALWETRIDVDSVTITTDVEQLIVQIQWSLKDSSVSASLEVLV